MSDSVIIRPDGSCTFRADPELFGVGFRIVFYAHYAASWAFYFLDLDLEEDVAISSQLVGLAIAGTTMWRYYPINDHVQLGIGWVPLFLFLITGINAAVFSIPQGEGLKPKAQVSLWIGLANWILLFMIIIRNHKTWDDTIPCINDFGVFISWWRNGIFFGFAVAGLVAVPFGQIIVASKIREALLNISKNAAKRRSLITSSILMTVMPTGLAVIAYEFVWAHVGAIGDVPFEWELSQMLALSTVASLWIPALVIMKSKWDALGGDEQPLAEGEDLAQESGDGTDPTGRAEEFVRLTVSSSEMGGRTSLAA
ncbi:hypothetical protein HDU93_001072 [Gonapodya sp. JEL0774]|nr:hypothetical protein HDU93_001072 [Gonapodya sp. JEL0774]